MKGRIKYLRSVLNLTQQEFADRIGIKRNSLANYETGRNTPINAIIVSICREFNVNETWLRYGVGDIFTSDIFSGAGEMPARLKYLRHVLNLSQQSFADSLGISRGNIAAYEVGKNNLSQSAISLICRVYNVNEIWLRSGSGDVFISSGDIAGRMKFLRNVLKFTQQDLANKIGVKQNTIAQYEMGRTVPSNAIIISLCREFNVNEEWLCNGTGKIFKSDRDTAIVRLENLLASEPDDSFKHHFINKLADLSPNEWNSLEKAIDIFSNKKK